MFCSFINTTVYHKLLINLYTSNILNGAPINSKKKSILPSDVRAFFYNLELLKLFFIFFTNAWVFW